MELESTKHGSREDEDLARNVEGLLRGAPVGPRSREERSDIARILGGLHYPATRGEVLVRAERSGADEGLVRRLEELPDGRFDVFEAIWEAIGGQPDPPRDEMPGTGAPQPS